tara:strand:- start:1050 stop:3107 length:2058 start_codon:yes stop_codon:yes gene_type:complete
MKWIQAVDEITHRTCIFFWIGTQGAPEEAWQKKLYHAFPHDVETKVVQDQYSYCDSNLGLHQVAKVQWSPETESYWAWKILNDVDKVEEKYSSFEYEQESYAQLEVSNCAQYRNRYLKEDVSHETLPQVASYLFVSKNERFFPVIVTKPRYAVGEKLEDVQAALLTYEEVDHRLMPSVISTPRPRHRDTTISGFQRGRYYKLTHFEKVGTIQKWQEIGGHGSVDVLFPETAHPAFSSLDVTGALGKNPEQTRRILEAFTLFSGVTRHPRLKLTLGDRGTTEKKELSGHFLTLYSFFKSYFADRGVLTHEVDTLAFEDLSKDDLSALQELRPTGGFSTDQIDFSNPGPDVWGYLASLKNCEIGKLLLKGESPVAHAAQLAGLLKNNKVVDLTVDLINDDIPRSPGLRPLEDAVIQGSDLQVYRPGHFDLATTDVRRRYREPVDNRLFTTEEIRAFIKKCQDISWLEFNVSCYVPYGRDLRDLIERSKTTLTRLDLSHTRFPTEGWQKVIGLLPEMASLETLELHHTNMANHLIPEIPGKLRDLSKLQRLDLDMPYVVSQAWDQNRRVVEDLWFENSPGDLGSLLGHSLLQIIATPFATGTGVLYDSVDCLATAFGGAMDQGHQFNRTIVGLEKLSVRIRLALYTVNTINPATQRFYRHLYKPGQEDKFNISRNGFENPDRVTFCTL